MGHAAGVIDAVTLVVGLLLLAAATLAASRRLKLPFTVLLVVVGVGLGLLRQSGLEVFAPLAHFTLSSELILFVFLPTLVFESAFHLDARLLRDNLLPILALAVPGLLISTSLIGAIVWAATDMEPISALLLGAILSATDPVAVIALFRQLGAPLRLTVLVEGESLFNDATAIVVAQVLLAIALAGQLEEGVVVSAGGDFLRVFIGGSLTGWLLALLTGWMLARVEDDPFIEISLVTALAYLSFLLAEHLLHVSGVMATVVAAITLGGWGRTKISPSVRDYMAHFWGYLGSAANALIFLLVGMQIEPLALADAWWPLLWVILAMLVSRALVIYGLLPLVERLPGAQPIERRYQLILFWGGLRGAIALALALSLVGYPFAEGFVTLVTGAVLFTLLIPGLSIEWLVRRLGLDTPPVADRLAALSANLLALRRAQAQIPKAGEGEWFRARVLRRLRRQYSRAIESADADLEALREQELTPDLERRLILLAGLSIESTHYYRLFSQGQLSEQAYRDLNYTIELQAEALRQGQALPAATLHPPWRLRLRRWREWLLVHLLRMPELATRIHDARAALDFERLVARHRIAPLVLDRLDEMANEEPRRAEPIAHVKANYEGWFSASQRRLDQLNLQHPRFVDALQERLAAHRLLQLRRGVIADQVRAGALPEAMAEHLEGALQLALHTLQGDDTEMLRQGPAELLRNLPLFSTLPEHELSQLVSLLELHEVPAGKPLLSTEEGAGALYLLASGVASLTSLDAQGALAERLLYPGEYFGEQVLLDLDPPLVVESRAVSACELYRLDILSMEAGCAACTVLHTTLGEARALCAESTPNG